jgi:ankyrin repeat protein
MHDTATCDSHCPIGRNRRCSAAGSSLGQARGERAETPLSIEFEQDPPELHLAAVRGDIALMERLLSSGAAVDERDQDGWTALHRAADAGHPAAARLLIRWGAEPNAEADDMESYWGASDVIRPGHFERRYKHAVRTPLCAALAKGNLNIAQMLMERDVRVNAAVPGLSGMTPLHFAAREGPTESVRLLLENGAEVTSVDDSGWTPLHWAAQGCRAQSAEMLLERGADANSRTTDSLLMWGATHWTKWDYPAGVTPLHVAAKALTPAVRSHRAAPTPERIAAVEVLVAHGARPDIPDGDGATPLDYATRGWASSALADALR